VLLVSFSVGYAVVGFIVAARRPRSINRKREHTVTKRTRGGRPGQRGRTVRAQSGLPAPSPGKHSSALAPAVPTGRLYASPPARLTYSQLLREETFSPMRSLAGVLLGVGLFVLLTPVVTQAVVLLGWALHSPRARFADYYFSA